MNIIKKLCFIWQCRKLIKVCHSACNNHVGYIKDIRAKKSESGNFYYLDGSQPESAGNLGITCSRCGGKIENFSQLRIQ